MIAIIGPRLTEESAWVDAIAYSKAAYAQPVAGEGDELLLAQPETNEERRKRS